MDSRVTSPELLTIGTLAERTGCSVPTIRYYEEIALIPQAMRKASGHRVYAESSIEQLIFIRHCRDFGFPIDDIKALISLAGDEGKDCSQMRDIAATHLEAVRTRLKEMRALEASLNQYVQSCSETCTSGAAPKCTLLKDITSAQAAPEPKKCCG